MTNPDFKKILDTKKGENRYKFVLAVSKRAGDVSDKIAVKKGSEGFETDAEGILLRERCGDENVVSFALDEFLSGKLEIADFNTEE